jgi:hypothetical protein
MMARAVAAPRTEITIGRGTVALRQDELDRLLRALGELRVPGVRIHLLPTESELDAIRQATRAAEPTAGAPGSALARLRALCDES